jgi:two-component system, NarL family, nitrate/nitrite response regulator NarL
MSTLKKIRLAMVDDHQIIIDGITSLIKEDKQFEIIVTANSAEAMLQLLYKNEVDILLTDVVMDGMSGQQLAKEVKIQFPKIKIIALSMSSVGETVEEMINDADISGYLLKQIGKQELVEAIKKVYTGEQYFQPLILDELEKQANIKLQTTTAHLTIREIEIIELLEKGMSNKDIADKLFLSIHTVDTHRKNILRKTNTNSLLSLIKWSYDHKIIIK